MSCDLKNNRGNSDRLKAGMELLLGRNRSHNRTQPLAVTRAAPAHSIKEHPLNLSRDGAALARADDSLLDFADRRDFRRRAGEESFVRTEQIFFPQQPNFGSV